MSTPSDESPIRIGDRYRLDERIGAGAMGAVWKATDELLNRTVAVKELLAAAVPARGGALEESRQRILREGRIGARLSHPHVISMFDVVVHDDSPWLVMEYLPSESLAQRLAREGPMPPREVADIGRQVADGLSAAHQAGVVHRDIKPGNVLLGDEGGVKLADFGVSRAVDDVQLTRTGLIAGTPAFLAPEIARGQDPSPASDVFALGATLYAAVEGHPPFGLDDNAYALLHKVATGVVEPPQQAGPLTEVMMRLLSADPDERPTAAQARDQLAKVATGQDGAPPATAVLPAPAVAAAAVTPPRPGKPTPRPTVAPPVPPRRRPEPAADQRRRIPVWLLALLAALVVGGVVTAILLALNANRAGTENPPGTPTATEGPAATSAEPGPTSTDDEVPPATTETAPTTAPTTTEPTTTTAVPTTTDTSTGAAPTTTDPVAFVRQYYSLLPGNVDAALAMLSPAAVARSGGEAGYRSFYARMESVSLSDVQLTGPNTVAGTVTFRERNGTTSSDPYTFTIGQDADGRTVMQTFDQR
jgi:hypothetical protein